MADGNFPILVFPRPARADREALSGLPGNPSRPGAGRQGKRLAPQFQRLQDALERRRIALQDSSLGIEPELVLVLETVGSPERFVRAVKKIEGLEWLAEHAVEGIPPGDGFEDAKDPERVLDGKLFLIMSDARALAELQSLFGSWTRDPEAGFSRGLTPLKHAFQYLRQIRAWSVEDRLADTGLLDNWNERAAFGQETVSFEAELWYRGSQSRRRAASEQLRHLLEALDGRIVSECIIHEISYHSILGRIEIARVQGLLDRPETCRQLALFRCDDIMFFRPVGQCAVPVGEDIDEVAYLQPPDPGLRTQGAPVVALLDGMPLTRHSLLDGRLVVDDPDGYEDAYQARQRSHGTAMASLICHDNLDARGEALGSPVYVRPIMQPREGFDGGFVEAVPDDILPVDLVHRAIVRIFDGEGDEPPASPGVRVVNLSICDPARPFITEMSSWARLLDWLSWKYDFLFVVSAGNHTQDISLETPATRFRGLTREERQRLVISAVANDTRNRRLLSPAETLNGVTVGAIHVDESGASPNHLVDPLATGMPSVSSAHGPGYRRAIKPDINLPGGRQLLSEVPTPPSGTVVLRPYTSTGVSGQRVATPGQAGTLNATQYTRGTSNAAALGSRAAFFLHELLEGLRAQPEGSIPSAYDAVLMKALLVHGADWGGMFQDFWNALGQHHARRTFKDYVARFLGYGQPDLERVVTGAEQRVTVVGFGSLDDGEAAEFSLPLPPGLSGVNVSRRMIVTLAWFSPINSRSHRYRVAHLWFGTAGNIASDRSCADYRAVRRGTVQHEVFEGSDAVAFQDGDEVIVKVNCREDADDILEPVRFGLAVTLEVPEAMLVPISIYEEVRERIAVRVQAAANAV